MEALNLAKKKIVQVTALDSTMNGLIGRLNKESIEAGYEVHGVCSVSKYREKLESQGLIVHDVKIDRAINIKSNVKSIVNLIRVFKKIKPDIVHVHTPVAAVLGRIAAKISGVPNIIYTAHGFYFHENMTKNKYLLFFYIEKYMGRYFTDYIFSQSKEDYKLAKKFKFQKNNRYLYIGNGVDLDEKYNFNKVSTKQLNDIKEKHNIKDDDLVVTFIGRLVKEKGILDFLQSYDELKNDNVKYIIIGDLPSSERDHQTYKKIVQFKNSNIHFTGRIDNVEEYLAISDVFCLPSYREGMPRSIIEAMAMKNAVIATNIRGSREEVVDGKTGFLVNLNSSIEIAQRVDELYENRRKLNEFKETGYHRAHELYNEKDVVKKQLEVFDRL